MTFARLFTIVVFLLEGVALYFSTMAAVAGESVSIQVGSEYMIFDGVGLLVSAVAVVLAFFVAIFSTQYMEMRTEKRSSMHCCSSVSDQSSVWRGHLIFSTCGSGLR